MKFKRIVAWTALIVFSSSVANAQFMWLATGAASSEESIIDIYPGEDATVSVRPAEPGEKKIAAKLPALSTPVTSFGAAVIGDSLYMYGGHTGSAHSYATKDQGNELLRLDLISGTWKTLADGPHLQGLALVAHDGKLYRVGGFTARNAEGEDHDLWSEDSVACFDPAVGQWKDLPPLPECRSSHDAAVIGDAIYVVGGWVMQGEADTEWHSTAWKLDLTQKDLRWESIADPPFQRRALALAAFGNRIYAVGGMQNRGGPTTAVTVYDPANDSWTDGPSLIVTGGDDEDQADRDEMSSGAMAGFGASAFATGGALYVTTVQGNLMALTDHNSEWKLVATDLTPRFFHRLLPIDAHRLIVVGGSNMSTGKFDEIEVIDVRQGS